MTEKKRQKKNHLRSARQWLSKAEEAFDQDHDVRGELDLFLAQAELRHAQEAARSQRWRLANPLLQHGLAFGLALAVAVVGIGGAYWLTHDSKQTLPAPVASSAKSPDTALKSSLPAPVQVPPVQQPQPAAVPVTAYPDSPPVKTVYPERAAPPSKAEMTEKQLPVDEMQKLIRAAGKSLRGDH